MVNSEQFKDFFVTFILSGSISSFTKTLVAPLERIKMILQNQESAYQVLTGERKKYTGIMDVVTRIPKEQGVLSFWRGNGVNIIRTFPTMALSFAFNDIYNHLVGLIIDTKTNFGLSKLLSGGLAGATAGTIVYPLEFCQTKLATDFGSDAHFKGDTVKREYSGLFNCISKVYKKEGYFGYFKGWTVEIVGVFWYRGLYFGLYELMKQNYMLKYKGKTDNRIGFFPNFLIATSTTIAAGLAAYPFDTVGRRMMMESARADQYKLFNSTSDAFKKLYQQNGIRIFYKGALVNSLRAVSSALVLVLYDQISNRTDWKNKIKTKL